MKLSLGRVLLITLVLVPAIALSQGSGIQIENAWSRAAMPGRIGVVYMTIVDRGAGDRLTGISSPVAQKAELHESFSEAGVSKMRPVPSLELDQGKSVALAPGGYHIMLMDLKRPLHQGDTFPVTLTFANAGQVTVQVTVQRPGAAMPMHMPMHGDGMPGTKP
jgi:periplasmic copper chaperone A